MELSGVESTVDSSQFESWSGVGSGRVGSSRIKWSRVKAIQVESSRVLEWS